jgi:hypothetical protein
MLNKKDLQLEKIMVKATNENLPSASSINLEIYRNYINELSTKLLTLQKKVDELENKLHKTLNTPH